MDFPLERRNWLGGAMDDDVGGDAINDGDDKNLGDIGRKRCTWKTLRRIRSMKEGYCRKFLEGQEMVQWMPPKIRARDK